MKKILLATIAAAICAAVSVPAMAVENQFGGYWRTRAYNHTDFDGAAMKGSESFVDTRTRLDYTAVFSPDFKFVNKFEFNTQWGDKNGGDINADAQGNFRVKHSYVDFNVGPTNWRVGEQDGKIGRGFLFNDDFSGVIATYKAGSVSLPFYWVKVSNGDLDKSTNDQMSADSGGNKQASKYGYDRDYYAISPVIKLNDAVTINPYLLYDKAANDGKDYSTHLMFIGADVDAKVGSAKIWGTAIYEDGKRYVGANNVKVKAYLAALGADAGLVHGQIFYATGDKSSTEKSEAFWAVTDGSNAPQGRIYYWSEIMGYGMFDNVRSNNAPAGSAISNITAANIGVTVKPSDKLTLTGDLWYARLNQPVTVENNNERELGTELDLVASYKIMPNLTLDLVGAYLFAGKATTTTTGATGTKVSDLEDPIEIGAQLSLSF